MSSAPEAARSTCQSVVLIGNVWALCTSGIQSPHPRSAPHTPFVHGKSLIHAPAWTPASLWIINQSSYSQFAGFSAPRRSFRPCPKYTHHFSVLNVPLFPLPLTVSPLTRSPPQLAEYMKTTIPRPPRPVTRDFLFSKPLGSLVDSWVVCRVDLGVVAELAVCRLVWHHNGDGWMRMKGGEGGVMRWG